MAEANRKRLRAISSASIRSKCLSDENKIVLPIPGSYVLAAGVKRKIMETKMITINKEKVAEVYQNASAETKEALKALFGNEIEFKRRPTLDDYTTIKTYEDACEALGAGSVLNEPNPVMNLFGMEYKVPPHIIALMKLETISRALWGKDWTPEPDAEGSKNFYYPVFALYTQQEIEDMDEDEREGLLSASANNSVTAGFNYMWTNNSSSHKSAGISSRLYQEDSEKAEYFGKQFVELWAEYLKFNFEVGGRLK